MSRVDELITEIKTFPIKEIREIRIAIHNFEKDQKVHKEVNEVVKFSSQALALANLLYDLMQKNYPSMEKPNIESWAEDIDKLQRINNQPFELIHAAIVWSQDNGFWKRNIRSGAALRKHFEKICIQGKFEQEEKKGKIHSV